MAEILIFALHLDNFERANFQKTHKSWKLASDEWTIDLQLRRAA